MNIEFPKRLESFEEGIFALLNEKKKALIKEGRKVYNMSIGTPDFEPEKHIIDAVTQAAGDPENYKYSIDLLPELREALKMHYDRRFGVTLKDGEISSLYGSQEGMAHIAMALCDHGDVVLVPDPGYPVFSAGPFLCGAQVRTYELRRENGYLIDFDSIDEDSRKKAKFMIVSYPLNPVCSAAPDSFYDELIAFADKNDIIIIHDNAYSDIIFTGKPGRSFLSFEGAKEVGVEFYSLSKSYNYTGARMSFVMGNEKIVEKISMVRSQIDYGIFLPVQYGAIAALTGPQDSVARQCEEYSRRNQAFSECMRDIGWDVPLSQGTMFSWAPIPKGFESSDDFVLKLMEKSGLILTPGSSFGKLGEGYVRIALVLPPETIAEAAAAVAGSDIIAKAL